MLACAHVFAPHVQAFATCGVSTRYRAVLNTCARWNGGKRKHASAWRSKTAATSKEEEAQRQRREHVPSNEEDAHVQTGRIEDPMEWDDEVEDEGEDALVWDECHGEETVGLTAEEDYVTPGNRIVLDACDDLFEMVEEEMKVRDVRRGRSHERTREETIPTARRSPMVGLPVQHTHEHANAWTELTAENLAIDACEQVLRQASELLELLGVSMETPGRNDTPTEESDEHTEEERTGQEQ